MAPPGLALLVSLNAADRGLDVARCFPEFFSRVAISEKDQTVIYEVINPRAKAA